MLRFVGLNSKNLKVIPGGNIQRFVKYEVINTNNVSVVLLFISNSKHVSGLITLTILFRDNVTNS